MKVGIFMANGLEEVECLTVVDLLRRAHIDVSMISIHETTLVKGAHNITIATDYTLNDINYDTLDGIILPGGMPGTLYLQENETVCNIVRQFCSDGRLIAAICAAPTVFGALGLLNGKKATCYPSMEDGLIGATVLTDPVAVDGNIITSRGVGTAIDFSLAIIKQLLDQKTADEIATQIVYHR